MQRSPLATRFFLTLLLLLSPVAFTFAEAPSSSYREPLAELVADSTVARDLKRVIATKEPGDDVKRQATLVIGSVKTATTRASGTTWERACWISTPDPKVVIVKQGKTTERHTTKVKQDVCQATYNETAFEVEEGDLLHIWVYDDDCICDDEIGEAIVQVSDRMIADGAVNWSFGQVVSLRMKFSQ